jgi:small subunit ribosomal protein S1
MTDMTEESEDFGAVLAEFEREQGHAGAEKAPSVGEKVRGEIISLGETAAFVDLGGKTEGMVHLEELTDEEGELTVAVGDAVEGLVTATDPDSGCVVIRVRPGRFAGSETALEEVRQAREHGIPVEGVVREVVKGGVRVEVAGLRAFCPISQLELGFVEDASEYVGRRLRFRIERFEESGRGGRPNVVLSRRVLLEEEARARAEEARAKLEVGKVVEGTVTSVTSYGAFVDLGGIEGLLHVSEMRHSRVEDPKALYTQGQRVEVEVIGIQPGKEGKGDRISLSRKSLESDPWEGVMAAFPRGSQHRGKVTRVEPYGAFVELVPGIDGLVHISELGADRPVQHAREVVETGDELEVEVLSVDPARRRISLARTQGAGAGAAEWRAARSSGAAAGFGTGSSGGSGGGLASLGDVLKNQLGPSEGEEEPGDDAAEADTDADPVDDTGSEV